MVQRVITLCDRHNNRGTEVDADLPPLVTIVVDGRGTEIDLCAECKAELNDLLKPYFEEGRRPGRSTVAVPTRPRRGVQADDLPRTPSGAISKSRILPSEADGKYYCKEENCPRSEWLVVNGERVHGTEPFRGPQGIYQHYLHSHGIRLSNGLPREHPSQPVR